MNTNEQSSADTGHSAGGVIRTQWLNPRRKRFWVILLMLIYTLLGFFVAPGIVKDRVIGMLQDDLGRPTRIEKVEINPLVLSLTVKGFEVRDTDDVQFVGLEDDRRHAINLAVDGPQQDSDAEKWHGNA
jgi:hypothetical protein